MNEAYFRIFSTDPGRYCARFDGRSIGTGVMYLADNSDDAALKIFETARECERIVVRNHENDGKGYFGVEDNMLTLLSDALYTHIPPGIDLVLDGQ